VVLATALPFYLVVNQEAVPARNVRELIEFAKARPGKLSYASAGNGSPHQLAMELLKLQTGIDATHVPYKINGELNRALAVPQVKEKLAAQGLDVVGGTPQEFRRVINADYEKWSRVVKAANIKPD
jgi:tripartite-type tricarboxylate transporter receptor subunit TctC